MCLLAICIFFCEVFKSCIQFLIFGHLSSYLSCENSLEIPLLSPFSDKGVVKNSPLPPATSLPFSNSLWCLFKELNILI